MSADGTLTIPSLGRPFQLGMLYDCRTESIISGKNLWDQDTLKSSIDTTFQSSSTFKTITEDTLSKKSFNLAMDANTKLSFMGGLLHCQVRGAAKYLNDCVSSEEQARVTLKYTSTNRFEKLAVEKLGHNIIQNAEILDEVNATHVVCGLTYGSDAYFVFDCTLNSGVNMCDMKQNMQLAINEIPSLAAGKESKGAEFTIPERIIKATERYTCKYYGDLILKSTPLTFQDAVLVYRDLPHLLSGSNGIPKKVVLYPISKLDCQPQQIIRSISTGLIRKIEEITESFHNCQVKIRDLKQFNTCSTFIGINDRLTRFMEMVDSFKLNFTEQISLLIPKIRGSGAEEKELFDIVSIVASSPFSPKQMNAYTRGMERVIKVLAQQVIILSSNPNILHAFTTSNDTISSIVADFQHKFVLCFAFNMTTKESPYLVKMEEYLTTKQIVPCMCDEKELYEDGDLLQGLAMQVQRYCNFAQVNRERKDLTFTMTNYNDDAESYGPAVILYSTAVAENFDLPSVPRNVTSKNVTHTSICLEWAAPEYGAHNITSYSVLYSAWKEPKPWTALTTTAQELSILVKSLLPNTTYHFKVQAVTKAGASVESECFSIKTAAEANAPIQSAGEHVQVHTSLFEPRNSTFKSVTQDSVYLEWEEPECGASNIAAYNVFYSTSKESKTWTALSIVSNELNTHVSGLLPNTMYHFKVQAVTKAGVSVENECLSIKTAAKAATPSHLDGEQGQKSLSKPRNIMCKNVTQDSVCLQWEEPECGASNITSYNVFYSTRKESTTWTALSIDSSELNIHISGLLPNTKYHFKVKALGQSGVSDESDCCSITTAAELRLAEKLLQVCTLLEEGDPKCYQLPLNLVVGNEEDKLYKFNVGAPPGYTRMSIVKPERVMIVLGATGAGKSTLINGIANFVLGVDWNDKFRFKIISDESKGKNKEVLQAHSQTRDITAYTLNNTILPYTLTIIDTPGFGDTLGIGRDKEIVTQIKKFFSLPGDNSIEQLHGIGFVTQASLARLTQTQKYIFDSVLALFGHDVKDNIFLMATFADANKPTVLAAVEAAEIPFNTSFKFNNSAIFASNDPENDEFNHMFWKMGTRSFHNFFDKFGQAMSRSLKLTRQVLQEREQLENLIPKLQQEICIGLNKLDEIKQEEEAIKKFKDQIDDNKDFEYEVTHTEAYQEELRPGIHTTTCLKCNRTCHENCIFANNEEKARCCAMKNNYCTVCPKECYWGEHKNVPYIIKHKQVKIKKTYENLKKKYESAVDGVSRSEAMRAENEMVFFKVQRSVFDLIAKARESVKRLDEIALKPNPLSEIEYIDLLIETEKAEHHPGWLERVNQFIEIRKNAVLLKQINLPIDDPQCIDHIEILISREEKKPASDRDDDKIGFYKRFRLLLETAKKWWNKGERRERQVLQRQLYMLEGQPATTY